MIDAVRVPPSATEHVAIELDREFTKLEIVEHGANAPPDQPLNLLRAAADLRAFAVRTRPRRARQHRIFGGQPPFAVAALPAGNTVFDGRGAQHARRAKRNETRAFGVRRDAALEGDGAHLVVPTRRTRRHGSNSISGHAIARSLKW